MKLDKIIAVKKDSSSDLFNAFNELKLLEDRCNDILNQKEYLLQDFADCWIANNNETDELALIGADLIAKLAIKSDHLYEKLFSFSYNDGHCIFSSANAGELIRKFKELEVKIEAAFGHEYLQRHKTNKYSLKEESNSVCGAV